MRAAFRRTSLDFGSSGRSAWRPAKKPASSAVCARGPGVPWPPPAALVPFGVDVTPLPGRRQASAASSTAHSNGCPGASPKASAVKRNKAWQSSCGKVAGPCFAMDATALTHSCRSRRGAALSAVWQRASQRPGSSNNRRAWAPWRCAAAAASAAAAARLGAAPSSSQMSTSRKAPAAPAPRAASVGSAPGVVTRLPKSARAGPNTASPRSLGRLRQLTMRSRTGQGHSGETLPASPAPRRPRMSRVVRKSSSSSSSSHAAAAWSTKAKPPKAPAMSSGSSPWSASACAKQSQALCSCAGDGSGLPPQSSRKQRTKPRSTPSRSPVAQPRLGSLRKSAARRPRTSACRNQALASRSLREMSSIANRHRVQRAGRSATVVLDSKKLKMDSMEPLMVCLPWRNSSAPLWPRAS
mmetsp:Transcript_78320/g.253684  ORF Transcript_78320/g.253684 Transcript_78320/m.253684 type:complete len:411 (+) Transcript_78320:151-1383(+)